MINIHNFYFEIKSMYMHTPNKYQIISIFQIYRAGFFLLVDDTLNQYKHNKRNENRLIKMSRFRNICKLLNF